MYAIQRSIHQYELRMFEVCTALESIHWMFRKKEVEEEVAERE